MKVVDTPYGKFNVDITPSPVDERDYIVEAIYLAKDLPEEYTCRDALLPVRNQGSQGSCAAQSAACMKEWQEKQDYGLNEYLSPQFVYNNRENASTSGMYLRDVMKILHKKGICKESEYKYGTFSEISDAVYKSAKKNVIREYAKVNTIDGLKKSLFNDGPCIIAVPVYNYGDRMWKPEAGQERIGGHAMTVIGWDSEGFIIRNSWGHNWNYDGYTKFPYEDWGLQWEIWSSLDDTDSNEETVKKSWFRRFIDWIKNIFN